MALLVGNSIISKQDGSITVDVLLNHYARQFKYTFIGVRQPYIWDSGTITSMINDMLAGKWEEPILLFNTDKPIDPSSNAVGRRDAYMRCIGNCHDKLIPLLVLSETYGNRGEKDRFLNDVYPGIYDICFDKNSGIISYFPDYLAKEGNAATSSRYTMVGNEVICYSRIIAGATTGVEPIVSSDSVMGKIFSIVLPVIYIDMATPINESSWIQFAMDAADLEEIA